MSESYSVEAMLSAKDQGFSSTMKSALGATESLGSKLKTGLGFGVLMAVGNKAVSSLTAGISGMVSEMSASSAAWKTFQGNMEMNGHTASDIKKTKDELQDFATKTIYSASDMASTFSQLDAVGTKNTTQLVKGFGGLAAAAENPQQAMKTLSQQATQMAAKPTVQWMDFKLMLEQTPAGIAAVAKTMGKSTSELIKDVQAGTLSTQDFFDAIQKTGTNANFTKLATQYKTVGQAMDGLKETASNVLMPAFNAVSGVAIKGISGVVDALGSINGDALAAGITGFFTKVGKYWTVFKTDLGTVGSAFGKAFSAIGGSLSKVNGAFGSTGAISNFKTVLGGATTVLVAFAAFAEKHADGIAFLIRQLPKLAAAYVGFRVVKTLAPAVSAFSGSVLKLASGGIGQIIPKLLGIATAEEVTGTASVTSGRQVMQAAVAFVALGAGVALIGAGFLLMANAAVTLASAGGLAIACMAGMIVVLAALAVGAAAIGPALTVGAIGFVAFGAAIALVGLGALLASKGLSLIATALPTIAQYGLMGSVAIVALGGALIVFAAGAITGGAAAIVLGAGLLIGTGGALAFGIAMAIAAGGTLIMAAALSAVNSRMKSIAGNAKSAETSLTSMRGSVSLVSSGLSAIGSKISSVFGSLKSAFNDTASTAESAGRRAGNGFADQVRATRPRVYASGAYISRGFALGMRSELGTVEAASEKLAEAADKAVRAKAKIGSPSRVSRRSGGFWGTGFALGITDKLKAVKQATEQMISIPMMKSGPQLAYAGYNGSVDLSDDYEYYNSGEYKIEVPLAVDGKEFARATAAYTQDELDKQQKHETRKHGKR